MQSPLSVAAVVLAGGETISVVVSYVVYAEDAYDHILEWYPELEEGCRATLSGMTAEQVCRDRARVESALTDVMQQLSADTSDASVCFPADRRYVRVPQGTLEA